MAFDAFLRLDGIKGESTDSKHKDEIEILSFSFGVTQSAPTATGRVGARMDVLDFSIVKNIDAASPLLFLNACLGRHAQSAVFTVRKSGGNAFEFLKIKLSDVIISSVAPAGSAGGASELPMETVSFDFAKIEIDYTTQTNTGAVGKVVHAAWDVLARKGL